VRRLLGRIETFLIVAGVVATATGAVILSRNGDSIWLPLSVVMLGVGLFTSPLSRRVGWVLTGVATVLLVIGLFVR
jgi:hypothetical protein